MVTGQTCPVTVHERLTRRYGTSVSPWLAALPRRLDELAETWDLRLARLCIWGLCCGLIVG